MNLMDWFKQKTGIHKKQERASAIHESNVREIRDVAKSIEEMNRILVKKSRAYQIYIATGRSKL